MPLIYPLDHSGFTMLEGYQGTTKISGTDDGRPWESYIAQTIPISGTNGALHVLIASPTGSSGSIYVTPDYSRATHSIDLVDTPVGTTSSDYNIYEYKHFCVQFSNMLNCTASISATMDSVATDPTYWIPVTPEVSGYHAITGSCIFCQDTPVKWEKVRVNFSKSITPNNSIDFWISLYN